MDIIFLVAQVFGIYLIVAGFFIIFRGKTLPHLMKDFFDHPAIGFLTGIILIFLSSIYLIQYNIWDGTWKMIVTLFVWIVMLKGLAYIFIPEVLNEISFKKFKKFFFIYGLFAIIVGLYLFFLN